MITSDILLSSRVLYPHFTINRDASKVSSISLQTHSINKLNRTTPLFYHRSFRVFCNLKSNSATEDDFITRVLKQNPSQVEPRFLIGEKFVTLKEKQSLETNKGLNFRLPKRFLEKLGLRNEVGGEKGEGSLDPVYLKDLLREFKGKLYVPEEVFKVNLSEEEEFNRILEELPKMSYEDFQRAFKNNKVKLLTSKAVSGISSEYGYRDFIVDLKEIPGYKSLQRTKWAMQLNETQAQTILEQYTGQQYEIESHTMSYVGKLPQYPHPVASSISSRMMVELGMLTTLMVAAAVVVGGFLASAVFAVTSFVFFATVKVAWPLAKPILKLVFSLISGITESIWENLYDIFSDGGIFSKWSDFYTFGGLSASLEMMRPIMLVFVTMVVLIRFTLSRRPKNFRKWDIWQGIEFGQSKPQARVDGSTGVCFADVAGIEEAVDELQELVRYLKNPELFDKMGIKPPHGVLLEGPPGCGKTLVAKAIAGEAGVPFYQMAGSEFVEVLVGVGSARIRDLFKRAKVNKPSVIFVDEIDALATRRQGIFSESTNYLYNAATQERETTLNQLLIELDGFDTGKGVIFLGATNRMDLLDPALLRPGRFDRKIRIRPPGAKGRLDILKVHARKVKMSPTVDLSSYAQNLPGWTGAKLAQLLQEAALVAVRRGHESILQSDVDDAVDRLTVGPKCVGIELGHQGQCRRATTEVGTAMISHLLKRYENANVEFCQRISINPRGQTLSQIVFHRLDDESYIFERRPQLLHRLQVLLGGRAAEEIIHGRDTSRASVSYLADASWLARKILTIWNLEKPMTIHGEPPPWRKKVKFVGPRLDFEGSLYDDYDLIEPPINFNMDDEVAQRTEDLIGEMYARTFSLLKRHHAALLKTVKVLVDKKEISGQQIEYILDQYPAETPIRLLLEEENPGSLPFFEAEQRGDMELALLTPSNGDIH
ncbi:Atp-dependent zinc metalloprotease ftsh [Thalictrum thalictroides]|uniref:Atp-dependent zinc metalloprotease ftsh n=1 Tax=Thalictrum thalictroides TaxID=46969 RepID=A0A7J6VDG1_THATH|nr:Atp-dependent zinc metalloprotease ftsh [Thalictrum thalictroides]